MMAIDVQERTKHPLTDRLFEVEAKKLPTGVTITSSTSSADPTGLTITNPNAINGDGDMAQVDIEGGVDGQVYRVTTILVLSTAEELAVPWDLLVDEDYAG
jgi:hypothetical protein